MNKYGITREEEIKEEIIDTVGDILLIANKIEEFKKDIIRYHEYIEELKEDLK